MKRNILILIMFIPVAIGGFFFIDYLTTFCHPTQLPKPNTVFTAKLALWLITAVVVTWVHDMLLKTLTNKTEA